MHEEIEYPAARKLLLVSGMLASLVGCNGGGEHYVIASTATVIGVELSESPVSQLPQAKLGYNRAELAIVPTNRVECIMDESGETPVPPAGGTPSPTGSLLCTPTVGNGAADATDVLMELRYGGIFSGGEGDGIYQRLAVGSTAVTQPGAAFMFVRDNNGDLDGVAASAVAQSLNAEAIAELQVQAVTDVADRVAASGVVSEPELRRQFVCAGFNESEATRLAERYRGQTREEFLQNFQRDFGPLAASSRDALAAC